MLAPSSVCIPSVCANPGLAVRVRGSARARTYDDRVKEIELAFHRKRNIPPLSLSREKPGRPSFLAAFIFADRPMDNPANHSIIPLRAGPFLDILLPREPIR